MGEGPYSSLWIKFSDKILNIFFDLWRILTKSIYVRSVQVIEYIFVEISCIKWKLITQNWSLGPQFYINIHFFHYSVPSVSLAWFKAGIIVIFDEGECILRLLDSLSGWGTLHLER